MIYVVVNTSPPHLVNNGSHLFGIGSRKTQKSLNYSIHRFIDTIKSMESALVGLVVLKVLLNHILNKKYKRKHSISRTLLSKED